MNGEKSLDTSGYKDLARNFPLLKELFEYAEQQGFDASSFTDYNDIGVHGADTSRDNPKAIILPERFLPLIAEHPGQYFVVAYENRQSSYFKPGTRERTVRLSTVRKKNKSDERVREIDLTEADPSLGNKAQVKITESVNNKSFAEINTATGDEVEQPHGQARYKYELDSNGGKKVTETSFNRLDEGIFPLQGENKPVRWVRDLRVERKDAQVTVFYQDLYIVGRLQEDKRDKRGEVKIQIQGLIDNPQSILVEIGGGIGEAKIIYENEERNMKVMF